MKLYHFEDSIVALEHLPAYAADAAAADDVATDCFRGLVLEAAEKKWPLDPARAHWFVDHDIVRMRDRIIVRVPIAGWPERQIPSDVALKGRFDRTGQAVTT